MTQITTQVKMEICSGQGEWAAAQAKGDPSSHWVALELRHDRVADTVMNSLTNRVFKTRQTNLRFSAPVPSTIQTLQGIYAAFSLKQASSCIYILLFFSFFGVGGGGIRTHAYVDTFM